MNPFERALAAAPDYVPSYLSKVSPGDFSLIGDTWQIHARTYTGGDAVYGLRLGEDDTVETVTINGVVTPDIPELPQRPVTLLDWYDAIVYLDGCGREADRQDPRWHGDDLDSELQRAEHNVVEVSYTPVRLEAFADPKACEDYLNRVLSSSPVRVEVRELSWPGNATQTGLGDASLIADTGHPDAYSPGPYTTSIEPNQWYEILQDMGYASYVYAQYMDAAASTQPTQCGAATAYRISDLPEYVAFEPSAEYNWWALCFPDLNFMLKVSPDATLLYITVDNNGGSVVVENKHQGPYAKRHELQERFQRRWGHLADDSIPHTDAEIDAAIATALEAIGGK